jgi:hypothetical protein
LIRAAGALGHALAVAGTMTWEITWPLILGFTLSAVIQAVVRARWSIHEMVNLAGRCELL